MFSAVPSVRLSVRLSVCPSVCLSVTIYPTHFVDTTSTLLGGRIETGLDSYESQDIEPWPHQGQRQNLRKQFFSYIGSTWTS